MHIFDLACSLIVVNESLEFNFSGEIYFEFFIRIADLGEYTWLLVSSHFTINAV